MERRVLVKVPISILEIFPKQTANIRLITQGSKKVCGWDGYTFSTPTHYIACVKYGDIYTTYGSFCSINCALSYNARVFCKSSANSLYNHALSMQLFRQRTGYTKDVSLVPRVSKGVSIKAFRQNCLVIKDTNKPRTIRQTNNQAKASEKTLLERSTPLPEVKSKISVILNRN